MFGLLGDGRCAQPTSPQVGHIDLIAVTGQKAGQSLARFGVEDAAVLDGAVHHQDRLTMYRDPRLNVAHVQPMFAAGNKQGLL